MVGFCRYTKKKRETCLENQILSCNPCIIANMIQLKNFLIKIQQMFEMTLPVDEPR